jgi:hypothetical protein
MIAEAPKTNIAPDFMPIPIVENNPTKKIMYEIFSKLNFIFIIRVQVDILLIFEPCLPKILFLSNSRFLNL